MILSAFNYHCKYYNQIYRIRYILLKVRVRFESKGLLFHYSLIFSVQTTKKKAYISAQYLTESQQINFSMYVLQTIFRKQYVLSQNILVVIGIGCIANYHFIHHVVKTHYPKI
jgi:hypothetical protein